MSTPPYYVIKTAIVTAFLVQKLAELVDTMDHVPECAVIDGRSQRLQVSETPIENHRQNYIVLYILIFT
jgi:hypothetical protein